MGDSRGQLVPVAATQREASSWSQKGHVVARRCQESRRNLDGISMFDWNERPRCPWFARQFRTAAGLRTEEGALSCGQLGLVTNSIRVDRRILNRYFG